MKKKLGLLLTLGLGLSFISAPSTSMAKEVKEKKNTYYIVEKGDNLSEIAEKYDTTFFTIQNNNEKEVKDVNVIMKGQKLLVAGKDFNKDLTEPKVQPETVSAPIPEADNYVPATTNNYVAPAPAPVNSGSDWMANRRMVENGGSYNWNTGNGYFGAYQFAPSTWQAYAANPNDHSPASQDQAAQAYANDRYKGGATVPWTGGW